MKFVLVFAVVFIAIWIWRRNRREEMQSRPPDTRKPPAAGAPQAMVRCARCGLHLPAADALIAPDGKTYCTPAHRQAGPA